MRSLLALVTALFFMIDAFSQNESTKQAIASLQDKLNTAVEQSDLATLDRYLHPQFTVHQLNGPYIPKDSLLTWFRNDGIPYAVFRPKAETWIMIDNSTVITSGRESFRHKEGQYADKEHKREFYHVWKKYKGEWVLAARNVVFIE